MTQEKKWRFPSNNYGPENGLDTGDVETFKKDPDAALATTLSTPITSSFDCTLVSLLNNSNCAFIPLNSTFVLSESKLEL